MDLISRILRYLEFVSLIFIRTAPFFYMCFRLFLICKFVNVLHLHSRIFHYFLTLRKLHTFT